MLLVWIAYGVAVVFCVLMHLTSGAVSGAMGAASMVWVLASVLAWMRHTRES
jgi:hypothetical protein